MIKRHQRISNKPLDIVHKLFNFTKTEDEEMNEKYLSIKSNPNQTNKLFVYKRVNR